MSDWSDSYPDDNYDEQDIDFLALGFTRVIRESKLAWLVEFEICANLESVDAWLPKSECHIDLKENTIHVPAWMAHEKGLEHYHRED